MNRLPESAGTTKVLCILPREEYFLKSGRTVHTTVNTTSEYLEFHRRLLMTTKFVPADKG